MPLKVLLLLDVLEVKGEVRGSATFRSQAFLRLHLSKFGDLRKNRRLCILDMY